MYNKYKDAQMKTVSDIFESYSNEETKKIKVYNSFNEVEITENRGLMIKTYLNTSDFREHYLYEKGSSKNDYCQSDFETGHVQLEEFTSEFTEAPNTDDEREH